MRLPIAIIGNGGAAAEVVLALRASGYAGEVHLFADNRHPPYNPMLGPYLVAGDIPLQQAFPFGNADTFYEGNRVTAHLGQPVVRLDAEARELTVASGETYAYERCVVACGARPVVPPVAGLREVLGAAEVAAVGASAPPNGAAGAGRRAFTLQTLDDALALSGAVEEILGRGNPSERETATSGAEEPARSAEQGARGAEPPRAAVLGASFAGVKIATVLHDLGFRVTLIERETSILPLAAHPEAARIMEAHLLSEGYELRLGAALAGVTLQALEVDSGPADATTGASAVDGPARARAAAKGARQLPAAVRLDFGALPGAADPGGAGGTACEDGAPREDVDLLVVCTGSRPALSFLIPGQVDIGTGILVDEHMRSSVPGLYAAGDVAQGKNLLSGRREIIGLWSSARYQGRAAGRSLAGGASGYPGGVPHNITHVGRMLFASVGCVDDYDEVTVFQDGRSSRVTLRRDGRVAGVNMVDGCLSAGVVRHALSRTATGLTGATGAVGAIGPIAEMEATWTSFSG